MPIKGWNSCFPTKSMPNYVSIKQGHSFIYCYYLAHDQEIVKNIVPCFGVMSSLAIVKNIQCSEPEHKMLSQNCNNVFSTPKWPQIFIFILFNSAVTQVLPFKKIPSIYIHTRPTVDFHECFKMEKKPSLIIEEIWECGLNQLSHKM